ncbi:hypothetical protein C7B80_13920 [Cyanosarcina cf. burmensis CCALA 770]|nr:hypothetical protein C7B80_13920 [Cyanosarcina cf. burmensis CCALA 770]
MRGKFYRWLHCWRLRVLLLHLLLINTNYLLLTSMFKQNKFQAPKRDRDGLTSYILLQQGDISTDNLAVTWVDVAPGCSQRPHSHAPEQVYVIISGKGRMIVGDEERDVAEGDLVHIPSNVVHSIINHSNEVLRYISASTPAFDLQTLYDTGKLRDSSSST